MSTQAKHLYSSSSLPPYPGSGGLSGILSLHSERSEHSADKIKAPSSLCCGYSPENTTRQPHPERKIDIIIGQNIANTSTTDDIYTTSSSSDESDLVNSSTSASEHCLGDERVTVPSQLPRLKVVVAAENETAVAEDKTVDESKDNANAYVNGDNWDNLEERGAVGGRNVRLKLIHEGQTDIPAVERASLEKKLNLFDS